MKKSKLLSVVAVLALSISTTVMASTFSSPMTKIPGVEYSSVEGRALSCHPGYIKTTGNSSPGSHSSHEFWCSSSSHGSGVQVKEKCDTIWYYSTIRYSCSKCSDTSIEDKSYTIHKNSHCSSY